MRSYVVRRLLLFVPALVGASLLISVLMRLAPGDIAEIRSMVLPLRPECTEALSEVRPAALITRDAMIGVALCQAPTAAR